MAAGTSPARIVVPGAAEAATLTRIAHAAKAHWGYPGELMRLWSADLTVTPALLGTQPFYAAARDGTIVGFYALSREGDAVELEHMWVDPPHMGTGIGRLLFEHAVATARRLGGTTLCIASDPYAEGFYLQMGARRVGSVPSTPVGRLLPVLEVTLGDGAPG